MKSIRLNMRTVAVLGGLAALVFSPGARADMATILANDRVTEVKVLDDPTDLWVSGADLEPATGFTLKPEGACLDDICIPIKQNQDSDLYVNRDGTGWVNVSTLADKLGQAYAVDRDAGVWSFGPVPAVRQSTIESAVAPDFEMTDRKGNVIKLSDYRGKKVLVVTWASW
mgnify:CR=1 FL=1